MRRTIAIVLVYLTCIGTSAAQSDQSREVFDKLRDAYRSRNDAEIFYWTLQAAAQNGTSHYRAQVGDHYWHGRGVAADPAQAVAWYRSAAALGSIFGMMGLARAHHEGRGAPASADATMHWLAEAADRDMSRAHFELASHYLLSAKAGDTALAEDRIARGLEASAASARRSLRDERAKANPIAAAYVAAGDAFACPFAAPPNLQMAASFWISAAADGYGPAWARLQGLARHTRLSARFCRW